jgi:hypothetical protein
MGSGSWSSATYDAISKARIAAGSAFGYDAQAKASGTYRAHESLDVKRLNAAGKNVRESRDSVEHPNSKPIIVGFDQTGSMGMVPRVVQQKLKTLFGILTAQDYVSDPQVAIAAYGDAANNEYVPLQFGQFESDNRIDEELDNLFLEGMGGGNSGETSNLLLYYAAHHTQTDAFTKRGKKGYLFLIGDERQIPITAKMVRKYIGDVKPLGRLDFKSIANDAAQKWDIKMLLIDNSAAFYQHSQQFYSDLFGPKNVVVVENPDNIAETIAAIIGFGEGRDRIGVENALRSATGSKELARVVADSVQKAAGDGGGLR